METTVFLKLAFFMMFLALVPTAKCQLVRPPPRPPAPQCAMQFALVNQACAAIPYTPVPHFSPPSPPDPNPPSLTFPPNPSPTGGDSQSHEHAHRHRHKHRHRHSSHMTPVQENCCRWLKDVNDECVCRLLVRLPTFLARPAHSYSVVVGDACVITYQCASRLRAD